MKVVALVASIPARRVLCERLLASLAIQSRPPDELLLRLDGYGDEPSPTHSFSTVWENRFNINNATSLAGPGARWIAALEAGFDPDDIIVCIDDDAMLIEAPRFVEKLVAVVESGSGAAAAMGTGVDGKIAQPGAHSRGQLIYAAGLGLTVRAKHLLGLPQFAAEVLVAGGPDMLGPLGDDDALVSAHLWKTGVPITHAPAGNVYQAIGSKATSHSNKRTASGEKPYEQKLQLQRLTGWPFQQRSKILDRVSS